jgi:osmotically inducible protein OsmC
LTLTAKVPGISEEEFQKYAKIAEEGCPVSAAFNFEITLKLLWLKNGNGVSINY